MSKAIFDGQRGDASDNDEESATFLTVNLISSIPGLVFPNTPDACPSLVGLAVGEG